MGVREWIDALVIAFVLAMFIRTFVVELFKIPSGSMSPTLLGDLVAEGSARDAQGETGQYLLIAERGPMRQVWQVFRKDAHKNYAYEGKKMLFELTPSQRDLFENNRHIEEHRIFVNKFAYWFGPPSRGDIVVFRVPFELRPTVYRRNGVEFPVGPYNRDQGVYVKRNVAKAGEHVTIGNDMRLYIDGKKVTEPAVFLNRMYSSPLPRDGFSTQPPKYDVTVPEGQALMFGDNYDNSLDSRYWGGVPYENLRGKAFFRYWPLKKIQFLNN